MGYQRPWSIIVAYIFGAIAVIGVALDWSDYSSLSTSRMIGLGLIGLILSLLSTVSNLSRNIATTVNQKLKSFEDAINRNLSSFKERVDTRIKSLTDTKTVIDQYMAVHAAMEKLDDLKTNSGSLQDEAKQLSLEIYKFVGHSRKTQQEALAAISIVNDWTRRRDLMLEAAESFRAEYNERFQVRVSSIRDKFKGEGHLDDRLEQYYLIGAVNLLTMEIVAERIGLLAHRLGN